MEQQCWWLVLLVACGVMCVQAYRGAPDRDNGPHTGFACEGYTLTIDCGSNDDKKIFVVRANYGRQNIGICNNGDETSGWNLQCISTRAARTVARICNGRQKCDIPAGNRYFGDPCYLTPKYLEVQFECRKPDPSTVVVPQTTIISDPTTTLTTIPATNASHAPTAKPKPTTTTSPHTKPWKSTATTHARTQPPAPIKHTTTTTEPMQDDQGAPPRRYCEETFKRDILWPRTIKGSWVRMTCPNNPEVRRAMWKCNRDQVAWEGLPNLSGCKSPEVEDLAKKMALAKQEFSEDIVTEVALDLEKTSQKQELFGGDIKTMSKIMKDLVTSVDTQTKNQTKPASKKLIHSVTESVLNTSSNILSEDKHNSWTDLPQATQAQTATRVISSVEESAYQLADTYDRPTVIVNITLNIVLEVNVIDTSSDVVEDVVFPKATSAQKTGGADWLDGGNSIRFSGNSIKKLGIDGLARLIFLTYNNLEKWLQPRPVPAAVSYHGDEEYDNGFHDYSYQELQGRDSEIYDPFGIETEVMDQNFIEIPAQGADTPPRNENEMSEPANHRPEDGSHDQEFSNHRPDDESHGQQPANDQPEDGSHDQDVGHNVRSTTYVNEIETTATTEAMETVAPTQKAVNKTSRKVNSKIISASVLQKDTDEEGKTVSKKGHIPLSEPVMYTLEHKTTNNVYNPTCSFWEYEEKTMSGSWSSFGCEVHDTNVTHTTCSCNHITNFAVLMDVQGVELSDEHEFALAFITYLGCVISIVCLLICFITFAAFKNLQCDRNTIHKNLVLCLMIAEILFLAGIMQYSKQLLCSIMAGLLHYFFLAAFMWMLIEGVQLYVMLVEVFEAEKSRVKYYYLVSYGTPALIVAISAAVNHHGYGTKSHCWLATEGGFIWAFVGPVVVIITVNIIMLSIAIYQMCKHANAAAGWKMKQKSKMESIRSWVKGASVLVVLLGLTWTFGLLYINQHTTFMAYIFTILNSLQGLFIFVFHCAMNEKIQKEYKRWLRRATWMPESLRVKYGGAKPYASTTPNQSSSSGNKIQSQKTTKTSPEQRVSLEYLTKLLSGRRRKRSSTTTVRSSVVSNGSKWHYQNMKQDPTSPRDSHLTDSGIGRNVDSMCDDQGGYLEPISIRVNDNILGDIEADQGFSLMEGSCVDTDCYGVESYKTPSLDVDKYKIKPPGERLSAISKERPISESDFSDGELLKMTETGSVHDYEEIPRTKSEEALFDGMETDGYNTLLQRKLRQYAEENNRNVPRDVPNMNNLDKGDNGNEAIRDSVLINTPNIQFSKDETFKCSLPSLNDNDKPPVVIEKLNKALSTSDDGMFTIARNTDRKMNIEFSQC